MEPTVIGTKSARKAKLPRGVRVFWNKQRGRKVRTRSRDDHNHAKLLYLGRMCKYLDGKDMAASGESLKLWWRMVA